jgi:hypothetical protein
VRLIKGTTATTKKAMVNVDSPYCSNVLFLEGNAAMSVCVYKRGVTLSLDIVFKNLKYQIFFFFKESFFKTDGSLDGLYLFSQREIFKTKSSYQTLIIMAFGLRLAECCLYLEKFW